MKALKSSSLKKFLNWKSKHKCLCLCVILCVCVKFSFYLYRVVGIDLKHCSAVDVPQRVQNLMMERRRRKEVF